jgi:hypothetical protein
VHAGGFRNFHQGEGAHETTRRAFRYSISDVDRFALDGGQGGNVADDPIIGTWRLSLEKSRYDSGPPPKSLTLKFEAFGNSGLKQIEEVVDSQGNRRIQEWSGSLDGKDYPVTGNPGTDDASAKRIDAHTLERINKKGGKITATVTMTITASNLGANDGKTLKVVRTSANPNGQPTSDISVFDKQ